jgi:hypothetical protein
MFDEHSIEARFIMAYYEKHLRKGADVYGVSLKTPPHDIARQLLNEIVEFKQKEE